MILPTWIDCYYPVKVGELLALRWDSVKEKWRVCLDAESKW